MCVYVGGGGGEGRRGGEKCSYGVPPFKMSISNLVL